MLNLNNIGRKGLLRIAKELKIKGFSTMKKDELMSAISDAINENEDLVPVVEEMVAQIEAETPVKVKSSATPSLGIKELTFNGKTQSITAWAAEVGLQRPALYDRINRHGWSVEDALTIPAGGRRKTVKAEAEAEVVTEDAE